MSNYFNKLLFGTCEEVFKVLDSGVEIDEHEVKAVLTNSFKRIQQIEKRLDRLEKMSHYHYGENGDDSETETRL